MSLHKICILLLTLVAAPLLGRGQSAGFDMLTIGPNTEALGLNEATGSLLLGASSIYSNPANLALEDASSLNADYSLWIAGLNHTHVAANFKNSNRAIAFGLLADQADDFELRSRPGPSEGSFNVSYLSLAGAYAVSYKNFAAGVSAQYLREEIYIYDASGYAINAGVSSHWLQKKLFISAAFLNAGKMKALNLEETSLPTLFRAGFSAELLNIAADSDVSFPIALLLSSDLVLPMQNSNNTTGSDASDDPHLNIGISINAAEMITLRGGFKTGETERPLSFGLGIAVDRIKINYALVPFKTGFGTVHSIGLGYNF